MTIADVLAMRQQLEAFMANNTAVMLLANPVMSRYETRVPVAAFDNLGLLEAYLKSSALPAIPNAHNVYRRDGVFRSWRPDSVLWDYNGGLSFQTVGRWNDLDVAPMCPWVNYGYIPFNPVPPTGLIPDF